jgi:death-on-curing protein
MEEYKYLSAEVAIEANKVVGNDGAVRDWALLDSALNAPRNAAYYEEADVVEQAAILIQRVALNHPFSDGNKRTAFVLGSTFLLINGYQIRYRSDEEEVEFAVSIEAMVAQKDFESMVEWIEEHLSSFEEEGDKDDA